MHTKDLASLLQLLQVSERSGLLTVEPSTLPDGEQWQGQFFLAQGSVRSCLIRSKRDDRVLLQGKDALHWLINQGRLEWWMEEQTQSVDPPSTAARVLPLPAQRSSPTDPGSVRQAVGVPRRTLKGMHSKGSEAWSRDRRRVFALVDGKKSSYEIAKMLGKSPEIVGHVLQDLAADGFIE